VVNRGEVWWVDHPAQGRRPFLVLTRQAVIPVVNKVTGVPATKWVRGIPSEVPLSADGEEGSPEVSSPV
jgi:mRNA-degrading endonuclease toxin of MazEF toxin-antitoxin module